jgi:mRNA interferase HigB
MPSRGITVAHVIAKARLRAFWERHRDAQNALAAWFKAARKARLTCLADMRVPFPSADQVGSCLIFDVCHNKYRLIVRPSRNWKRLFVRHVLIHRDYDKGHWKKGCTG